MELPSDEAKEDAPVNRLKLAAWLGSSALAASIGGLDGGLTVATIRDNPDSIVDIASYGLATVIFTKIAVLTHETFHLCRDVRRKAKTGPN